MRPIARTLSPGALILVAFLAGAAVLVISFAYDKWHDYRNHLSEVERGVRSDARVLAEHTASTLEAARRTLWAVGRLRQEAQLRGLTAEEAARRLSVLQQGASAFRSIGWLEKDGGQLWSDGQERPDPWALLGREAFPAAERDWRAAGKSAVPALSLAAPVMLRGAGGWHLAAFMPAIDAARSFDGLLVGDIDPGYFGRVYGSVARGDSDIKTLFRVDGTILLRQPAEAGLIGTSLAGRPFVTEVLAAAPDGSFHASGLGDQQARIIGFATVPGSDLVVTVARRRDEALAAFHAALRDGAVRTGLVILVFGAGAWLLAAQMRRRETLAGNLKANEARFQDFAAASGDWFWETDTEHRLTWVSRHAGDATNPADQSLGRNPIDLIDPGSVSPEAIAAHLATLRARQSFKGFCYARTIRGRKHWLMVAARPVFDADGTFRGYRGSGRDITDLRRAEAQLQEAVDAIPGDFVLFDPDGRLAFRNSSAARQTGAMGSLARLGDRMEDILRRGIAAGELLDAGDDPEAWIAWRLRQHRGPGHTTLVRFPGGVTEVIERPTADGGVIMLRFDVTEREAARAALRDARDAAEAANRAKSDFLASMSHELRTPLNAIIGFGQMLELDQPGTLTERQKEYSGIIVRSGNHLMRLVDDVLDLAGIEAGRLTLTDGSVALSELFADAVATVQQAAQRQGVVIEPLPAVSLPDLAGDRQRLSQVLINLLSNAIKYNRPGGSVGLAASMPDEHRVRITVKDTGIGIAPEKAAQLFTPFQRLGAEFSAVEGCGIGLALSRRLVEMMDGRIGYQARPGGGSLFWFEIPVAASHAAAEIAAGTPQPRRGSRALAGGFSLLCVEDNPVNLGLIQQIMATLPGCRMLSTQDGATGLDLAKAHGPDVIVLDLHLPAMDGYAVLQRLQEDPATAAIPVIALTSAAMPAEVQRGLASGFFEYLTKPLDIGLLLAAIDRALRERRTDSLAG